MTPHHTPQTQEHEQRELLIDILKWMMETPWDSENEYEYMSWGIEMFPYRIREALGMPPKKETP